MKTCIKKIELMCLCVAMFAVNVFCAEIEKIVSEDKLQERAKEKLEPAFCKGVNYVSWTTGDYPFTTAWKNQTYSDSQGITQAKITTDKAFSGRGSLELTLDMRERSKTHRNGEVFVDLRYPPSYNALYPIRMERYPNGKPIGLDLSGKTLAAVVFCSKGTSGSPYAPNGLQLFLKSVDVKDGNEVWSSYYGNWHNIWKSRREWSAAIDLGNIREGVWSLISVEVPYEIKVDKFGRVRNKPFYGYVDKDFNPKKVALMGIKYGLNENFIRNVSGKIYIDDLGWKDIVSEGDATFSFSKVFHPYDVKIWEYFGSTNVPPLSFKEGIIFKRSCVFRCVGNSVFVDFEQVENPIESLKKNGFNMVALVNTEYMNDKSSVEIGPVKGKSHPVQDLELLIKEVHSKNLRVMLKPHVDVQDDSWRGEIKPASKEDWFRAYEALITRYAELAERYNVEMLAVGTEFKSLNGSENRSEWEKVIDKVRSVYSGTLTYAANWDDYRNVCFWDLVDAVGIDAYFPINLEQDPSIDELVRGWSDILWEGEQRNWVKELDQWQKTVNKDIIFTEIGYRSTDYSAREPWEYQADRPLNLHLQLNCYKALLEAFKEKPWFKGVFFWYWSPKQDFGGKFDTDFTPQNKPAEKIFNLTLR